MVFGLLCLSNVAALAYFTIARPLETNQSPIFAESDRGWLWGWTWGTESTVSVIDHNPVVSFPSRPGEFIFFSSVFANNLPCSCFWWRD